MVGVHQYTKNWKTRSIDINRSWIVNQRINRSPCMFMEMLQTCQCSAPVEKLLSSKLKSVLKILILANGDRAVQIWATNRFHWRRWVRLYVYIVLSPSSTGTAYVAGDGDVWASTWRTGSSGGSSPADGCWRESLGRETAPKQQVASVCIVPTPPRVHAMHSMHAKHSCCHIISSTLSHYPSTLLNEMKA